jgi:hypothetical protein
MLGILGRLIALAGVIEAARRFAKKNPETVGKIVRLAASSTRLPRASSAARSMAW